jgi:hypothetical protein
VGPGCAFLFGKDAAMQRYFLQATIQQLKAELKASKVKHQIDNEEPALLVVKLGDFTPSVTIAPLYKPLFGERERANEKLEGGDLSMRQARVRGRPYAPDIRRAVRRMPEPTAHGTITAVEQPGGVLRLIVELKDDTTLPRYDEVHKRWEQLRNYLGPRLTEQEPEGAGRGQEMAALPTERLTVYDTPSRFAGWLNAYGKTIVNGNGLDGKETWYYDAIYGATVELEFDPDRYPLEVTATLETKRSGPRFFNGDSATLARFKALCDAIRRRQAMVLYTSQSSLRAQQEAAADRERMERLIRALEKNSNRNLIQERIGIAEGMGMIPAPQPPDSGDELAHIKNPKIRAMVKEYIEVVCIQQKYGESRQTVSARHNFDSSSITRNLPEKYKQKNKRRRKL